MPKIFVSQRKLRAGKSRSILQRFIAKKVRIADANRSMIRLIFVYSSVIITIAVLIGFLLQRTLFSVENKILSVRIMDSAISVYNDMDMYQQIVEKVQGKNMYRYKTYGRLQVLSEMKNMYPFISDITTVAEDINLLVLDVSFEDPILVVNNNDKERAIYSATEYVTIHTGNQLASGVMRMYLPIYLYDQNNLAGLFYMIGPRQLADQMHMIYNAIDGVEKIVYLAGSEKMAIVLLNGQRIFVNNMKDMQQQMQKIIMLKTDGLRSYSGLSMDEIGQIDVGSLDYIIVKKW